MFFTGIIPSLLALVLRLKMNESELWREKLVRQTLEKAPLKKAVSGPNKKALPPGFHCDCRLMYSYYASIGFMPTLLEQYIHLRQSEIATIMAAGTFSSMLGYIFSGWLSQNWRIRTIGFFATLSSAFAVPLLLAVYNSYSISEKGIYVSILLMLATAGFGPIPAFLSERFPTQIRNTAAGLSSIWDSS